eukprot:1860094-Prymnesium_polylepis.1
MGFLSLAVCGGRRGADVWGVHRDCSQPRMLSLEPQYVFIVFTLAFSGAEFHPNTCRFRMRIPMCTAVKGTDLMVRNTGYPSRRR